MSGQPSGKVALRKERIREILMCVLAGDEMELCCCEERLWVHVAEVKGKRSGRCSKQRAGHSFFHLEQQIEQERLPGLAHPETRVAEATPEDCQCSSRGVQRKGTTQASADEHAGKYSPKSWLLGHFGKRS